jgi:hypothetical protein
MTIDRICRVYHVHRLTRHASPSQTASTNAILPSPLPGYDVGALVLAGYPVADLVDAGTSAAVRRLGVLFFENSYVA